jgi:hypothetical protein
MKTSRIALALALALALPAGASAQADTRQSGLPDPIPPPLPPPPKPDDAFGYEPLVPESDLPWGLDAELLAPLHRAAEIYRAYMRKFTCEEEARVAEYGETGEVSDEKVRHYGYILVKSSTGDAVREYRQEIGKNGELKSGEVRDEEPFPPAYAWVFLFSRFNENYFSYRYIEERFDGFDWVHEIQFKGSQPFTDGKDIRQWEGSVLIDAVTHTPIEIRAEPLGQLERIRALYQRWASSFNFMGMRSAPKPLGFRAEIQFRERRESLAFPTELRYDTFRAVGAGDVVPTRASVRSYRNYRIQRVDVDSEVGETVEP